MLRIRRVWESKFVAIATSRGQTYVTEYHTDNKNNAFFVFCVIDKTDIFKNNLMTSRSLGNFRKKNQLAALNFFSKEFLKNL